MKLAVVILAAGFGRRFGSNKLYAEWNGVPLYKRTIKLYQNVKKKAEEDREMEITCELILVTQYEKIYEYAKEQGLKALINPHPELGISSTMKIGLKEALTSDACMFAVSDQPWLKEETVIRLIKEYANSKKQMALVSRNGISGNPCIFSGRYYQDLLSLEGDRGGKRILNRHPEDVVWVEAGDDEELKDMDVPVNESENQKKV